jgi:rubrerythrin
LQLGINADEIFEMAKQIERNGARFYRLMAENISHISGRELFLGLAAMENEHQKVFASIRNPLFFIWG